MKTTISIRFYEELNDFLKPEQKKQTFEHNFKGMPNIKDVIESLGVPHTEVDLIIVNGQSVDFNYKPNQNDHISVYPIFESFDISPIIRLRAKPLRETKFVLDVHLGKLARYLRLLGFDVLYNNNYRDDELIEIAQNENRILLTRDINLLKNKMVTHGYWLRNTVTKQQLKEIVLRFNLQTNIISFTRCLECNGILQKVDKKRIEKLLPEQVANHFEKYHECSLCHKVYWEGSHYDKLKDFIVKFIKELS